MTQDPIGLMGGSNLFHYQHDPLTQIDPLGLAKAGRSSTTGRYQTKSAKPPKSNPQKVGEMPGKWEATYNSIRDKMSDLWDFINPAGDEFARIDEAMICTRQKNTETGVESKPHDVMVEKQTMSTKTAVIRTPTSSEVNSLPGTVCIETKPRPNFDAGPLPGLGPYGR
ncbi:hypothetical protein SDC9_108168 [bioreactor metagenome]|uniref:Uncharacterized protein n=1 Tax=bioreactor metagenome TaxID=1076179 RepID=A0A645B787_9ZZZZ